MASVGPRCTFSACDPHATCHTSAPWETLHLVVLPGRMTLMFTVCHAMLSAMLFRHMHRLHNVPCFHPHPDSRPSWWWGHVTSVINRCSEGKCVNTASKYNNNNICVRREKRHFLVLLHASGTICRLPCVPQTP